MGQTKTISFRNIQPKRRRVRSISIALFLLAFIVLLSYSPLRSQFHPKNPELPVLPDKRREASLPKTLFFQKFAAYYSKSYHLKTYRQAEDKHIMNSGNFIWRYAARELIDHSQLIYCEGTIQECTALHPESKNVVAYHPTANLFTEIGGYVSGTPQHNRDIRRKLLSYGTPYVLLGAGAQGMYSANKTHRDFHGADGIELSADNYQLIPEGVELLTEMQRQKQVIFFRGAFTDSVARRNGYTLGVVTGCPSLMLNKEVRLGAKLQPQYEALRSRKGDMSLKVALTFRPDQKYADFLISLMNRYPNSIAYVQGKMDLKCLKEGNIPFHRIRFYPANAEEWIESLKGFDVSMGARIHGNMAALGAQVPVFLISPDYRVEELAQAMGLPRTTWYDRQLSTEMDIAEIVGNVGFDGAEFDMNRCKIAKTYVGELGKLGVTVAQHVYEIANIC